MSGRAKFVFWWDHAGDHNEAIPFFNVIENDKGLNNGSTVDAGQLQRDYEIPLPLFPSFETWHRETIAKRKCFRCWATVKGATDLTRHRVVVHHERDLWEKEVQLAIRKRNAGLAAALILAVLLFSGCNTFKRAFGVKEPNNVSVPKTTAIERQLPPSPASITFHPDPINGAPNQVRVFVKNGDWLTATPGAWYEIPYAVAVDTRTTEYAVIDFAAQTAVVYNQPATSPRAITVESLEPGAFDPGVPAASIDMTSSHDLY